MVHSGSGLGTPVVQPFGDRALTVSLPDADAGLRLRLLAAAAGKLREAAAGWIVDAVPAYETVTVVYDPLKVPLLAPAGTRRGLRETSGDAGSVDHIKQGFAGMDKRPAPGSAGRGKSARFAMPTDAEGDAEFAGPGSAGGNSEFAMPAFAGESAEFAVPEMAGASDIPYERAAAEVLRLLNDVGPAAGAEPRTIGIPVCYGGAYGPDLAAAAARSGMSERDFVDRHCAVHYTVAMIGFMPGFPYLTGLPQELAQPRRGTPRSHVPAGSVGIGGSQTGIYPLASPGGWQLIGRTSSLLFDPRRSEPSLLRAGDRLRFVPVDAGDLREAER